MDIDIESLKISVAKNAFGTRIIFFNISKLKLHKEAQDLDSDLSLIGTIEVDYLNRRISAMEPLLEPWTF